MLLLLLLCLLLHCPPPHQQQAEAQQLLYQLYTLPSMHVLRCPAATLQSPCSARQQYLQHQLRSCCRCLPYN
jgi:hypothetical protein